MPRMLVAPWAVLERTLLGSGRWVGDESLRGKREGVLLAWGEGVNIAYWCRKQEFDLSLATVEVILGVVD